MSSQFMTNQIRSPGGAGGGPQKRVKSVKVNTSGITGDQVQSHQSALSKKQKDQKPTNYNNNNAFEITTKQKVSQFNSSKKNLSPIAANGGSSTTKGSSQGKQQYQKGSGFFKQKSQHTNDAQVMSFQMNSGDKTTSLVSNSHQQHQQQPVAAQNVVYKSAMKTNSNRGQGSSVLKSKSKKRYQDQQVSEEVNSFHHKENNLIMSFPDQKDLLIVQQGSLNKQLGQDKMSLTSNIKGISNLAYIGNQSTVPSHLINSNTAGIDSSRFNQTTKNVTSKNMKGIMLKNNGEGFLKKPSTSIVSNDFVGNLRIPVSTKNASKKITNAQIILHENFQPVTQTTTPSNVNKTHTNMFTNNGSKLSNTQSIQLGQKYEGRHGGSQYKQPSSSQKRKQSYQAQPQNPLGFKTAKGSSQGVSTQASNDTKIKKLSMFKLQGMVKQGGQNDSARDLVVPNNVGTTKATKSGGGSQLTGQKKSVQTHGGNSASKVVQLKMSADQVASMPQSTKGKLMNIITNKKQNQTGLRNMSNQTNLQIKNIKQTSFFLEPSAERQQQTTKQINKKNKILDNPNAFNQTGVNFQSIGISSANNKVQKSFNFDFDMQNQSTDMAKPTQHGTKKNSSTNKTVKSSKKNLNFSGNVTNNTSAQVGLFSPANSIRQNKHSQYFETAQQPKDEQANSIPNNQMGAPNQNQTAITTQGGSTVININIESGGYSYQQQIPIVTTNYQNPYVQQQQSQLDQQNPRQGKKVKYNNSELENRNTSGQSKSKNNKTFIIKKQQTPLAVDDGSISKSLQMGNVVATNITNGNKSCKNSQSKDVVPSINVIFKQAQHQNGASTTQNTNSSTNKMLQNNENNILTTADPTTMALINKMLEKNSLNHNISRVSQQQLNHIKASTKSEKNSPRVQHMQADKKNSHLVNASQDQKELLNQQIYQMNKLQQASSQESANKAMQMVNLQNCKQPRLSQDHGTAVSTRGGNIDAKQSQKLHKQQILQQFDDLDAMQAQMIYQKLKTQDMKSVLQEVNNEINTGQGSEQEAEIERLRVHQRNVNSDLANKNNPNFNTSSHINAQASKKLCINKFNEAQKSTAPSKTLSPKNQRNNRQSLSNKDLKHKSIAEQQLDRQQQIQNLTYPISANKALRLFGSELTEYEQKEIQDYKSVYFLGLKAKKIKGDPMAQHNFGYSDERGDYHVVLKDHIAYRFEVLDFLGQGSFGQAIKCLDHKTQEVVAIKIIRNKKKFQHQARVELKILQHLKERDPDDANNIIRIKSHCVFRGHLIISFELFSINLYEFIKNNEFKGVTLSLIRRFAIQILQSLKFLREEQIIHCDLKPENILLKSPDKSGVKVIDFGSSCFQDEVIYTYIQSRFYRAPEIVLGIPYTPAIDMWSFGCILAELFTGIPVFPGESEQEQLALIMEVRGPPPDYLLKQATRKKNFFDDETNEPYAVQDSQENLRIPNSKPLEDCLGCQSETFLDFIERCLEWDPEERITPFEALQHPWIIEGLPPKVLIHHKRMLGIQVTDPDEVQDSNTSKQMTENSMSNNWVEPQPQDLDESHNVSSENPGDKKEVLQPDYFYKNMSYNNQASNEYGADQQLRQVDSDEDCSIEDDDPVHQMKQEPHPDVKKMLLLPPSYKSKTTNASELTNILHQINQNGGQELSVDMSNLLEDELSYPMPQSTKNYTHSSNMKGKQNCFFNQRSALSNQSYNDQVQQQQQKQQQADNKKPQKQKFHLDASVFDKKGGANSCAPKQIVTSNDYDQYPMHNLSKHFKEFSPANLTKGSKTTCNKTSQFSFLMQQSNNLGSDNIKEKNHTNQQKTPQLNNLNHQSIGLNTMCDELIIQGYH